MLYGRYVRILKKCLILMIVFLSFGCFFHKDNFEVIKYDDYISIIKAYPHKTDSFTEGLFFNDGELYETTGLYGKSKIYKNINLESGDSVNSYTFSDDIFGEGSVIFKDKLYVLTYKEKKVFVFDKDTLELLDEYDYDREGWGLTTDGEYLIASDGTEFIYYMDENLKDIRKITVSNGRHIKNINELEYINGYIWANVWQSDYILIINPLDGKVVKKIDFKGVLSDDFKNDNTDVLNGIAWNDNKLYITGKNYPLIFECKVSNRLFKEIKV